MSKLIEFLEQLGQDSQLRRASEAELQVAMERAGLDLALRVPLLTADRRELETMAGAPANVCCVVQAAEDGDESEAFPAPALRRAA